MKKVVILFSGLIVFAIVLSLLAMPSPALAQEPGYAFVDIKPGSCPNPINTKKKGVTPVAIVGTETFDVTTVDPTTVTLLELNPVAWEILDSTMPYKPYGEYPTEIDCNDCFDAEPYYSDTDGDGIPDTYLGDGFDDLILYFDTPSLVEKMEPIEEETCILLILYGKTYGSDDFDIKGWDNVRLLGKKIK